MVDRDDAVGGGAPPGGARPARAIDRRRFLAGLGASAGLAALAAACGSPPRSGAAFDDIATAAVPRTVRYGDAPRQQGELWLPAGDAPAAGWPVVVLLHGGFWEAGYTRAMTAPLAAAVAGQGWAAWNVGYRPVGAGGGWPGSFVDAADAVDLLAGELPAGPVDATRVATLGLGAGGCMALWLAARGRLGDRVPGAGPAVTPVLAVSMAGLNNLAAAVYEGLGNGAVRRAMGGLPNQRPAAYEAASPVVHLPIGVPQALIHDRGDPIVPLSQSTAYAGKAEQAEDPATLEIVPGRSHFDLVDPNGKGWAVARPLIARAFGG